MDTFVNPIPGIRLDKALCFDFPLGTTSKEYRTPGCNRNVDLTQPTGPGRTPSSEVPAMEGVYGLLGTPKRNQGFPCIGEYPNPEAEDPSPHDQIIDIDREATFDHTARLSGNFVKYLVQANHQSVVKMTMVALTQNIPPLPLWNSGLISLIPMTKGPNVWYWENPATRTELIFTAHAVILRNRWRELGIKPGIYKLVINWEFWDIEGGRKERMPISGFDESMSFELSDATVDF